MAEKEKEEEGQFDFRLIVSRSEKIKLTCYCKSKGKRKRARFIVSLLKKRPRQKQIPHSVRDDKKGKEEKADSSRKSAMAQRSEPAKKRRFRNDKFGNWDDGRREWPRSQRTGRRAGRRGTAT